MEPAEAERAVHAAKSAAAAAGLAVDGAHVLSDSNRLVVRLTPCNTVARAAPRTHLAGHLMSPEREVAVVDRLTRTGGGPVAALDARVEARVREHDGFTISLWAHCAPLPSPRTTPDGYGRALGRLHGGLRRIELDAPHVADRVAAVQRDVADRGTTPDLAGADRALLADRLHTLRGAILERQPPEQLLHGEPHPGNLLDTVHGPLFIDFENTARGPVEYDLAWVPASAAARCPGADPGLLDACRGLVLAMVAAYRWRRGDRHPSGRASGAAFLDALRAGPPWPALDQVTWPRA